MIKQSHLEQFKWSTSVWAAFAAKKMNPTLTYLGDPKPSLSILALPHKISIKYWLIDLQKSQFSTPGHWLTDILHLHIKCLMRQGSHFKQTMDKDIAEHLIKLEIIIFLLLKVKNYRISKNVNNDW